MNRRLQGPRRPFWSRKFHSELRLVARNAGECDFTVASALNLKTEAAAGVLLYSLNFTARANVCTGHCQKCRPKTIKK